MNSEGQPRRPASSIALLLAVVGFLAAGCDSDSRDVNSRNANSRNANSRDGDSRAGANSRQNAGDNDRPADKGGGESSDGAGELPSGAQPIGPALGAGGDNRHVKPVGDNTAGSSAGNGQAGESLFDWPRPQLALAITGRQHGYIEPCGCAGLATQKGGLSRRHTLLTQLRKKKWPLVVLDAGNQIRRFGRQPEIKFQATVDGLKMMNVQAIGLGPDDLRLSLDELLAPIASEENNPGPFLCANVDVLPGEFVHPRYLVIPAGDKKVGVTAILGSDHQRKITSNLIAMQPPATALREVVPLLSEKQCDVYVLLAHTTIEESRALARQFPQFDIVVTTGGAGEPKRQPEAIDGSDRILVEVGTKGMYVGVIGLYDDKTKPLRYQRVALDGSFEDSAAMLKLFRSYQDTLQTAGLAGLQIKPVDHPSGNTFVGSAVCGDCHTKALEIWEKTPHAHATQTLVTPPERYQVPRHFDPECLSCHVTGWNPQEYFPYKSGYLELKASKHLHGSGCENCHGPGSRHVAAENGQIDGINDEMIDMLRAQMRLPLAEARDHCLKCHDLDNSPDFHVKGAFEKYWKKIEHIGVD